MIHNQNKTLLIFILITFSVSLLGCTKQESNGLSTTNSQDAIPFPPVELKIKNYTAVQVELIWTDKSTNETGFKIERKTNSTNFTFLSSVGANITSFIDITVQPNTSYTYRVYSYNSSGQSPTYSNEISITTLGFDLKNGLIAFFPFTGNAGDSSGYNNHGIISTNGVSLTADRKNQPNKAFRFNPINNNDPSIQFVLPGSLSIKKAITISAWINVEGVGVYLPILSANETRSLSTSDNSIGFYVDMSKLRGRLISDSDGGGGSLRGDDAADIPLLTWNHVVFVYDESGLAKLYLNGSLYASKQFKPINDKEYITRYFIGRRSDRSEYFIGKIDDLRIYNRGLNDYEISILSKM